MKPFTYTGQRLGTGIAAAVNFVSAQWLRNDSSGMRLVDLSGRFRVGRPQLKTLTSVMLGSLQPMLIVWGPSRLRSTMTAKQQCVAIDIRRLWAQFPCFVARYQGSGRSDQNGRVGGLGHMDGRHRVRCSGTDLPGKRTSLLSFACPPSLGFCARNVLRLDRNNSPGSSATGAGEPQMRFVQVFELNPGGIVMLAGKDHVFEYANEQ